MKRFSAHYIYCNPQQIIKKGVVELDTNGALLRTFSLLDDSPEVHSTEFHNGIIISQLIREEDLPELVGKSVFEELDKVYKLNSLDLQPGYNQPIFLLENLDLIKGLFTESTTLTRLL